LKKNLKMMLLITFKKVGLVGQILMT
jgi:hypothetical protein